MGAKLTKEQKNSMPYRTLYQSPDKSVIDVTGYDKKHYVFRKKEKIKENLLRAKKTQDVKRKKRSKV